MNRADAFVTLSSRRPSKRGKQNRNGMTLNSRVNIRDTNRIALRIQI